MKFLTTQAKTLLLVFLMVGITSFGQNEVSDAELKQFATTFTEIQNIGEQAENQLIEVIESAGFELNRFNELYTSSQNGQTNPTGTTEEETKRFTTTLDKMEAMQPVFEKQVDDAIAKGGITSERYEEIMMMLYTDNALQQRLQAILE